MIKKKILIIISLVLIDFIFFYSLFFPNLKSIVTPELGGGDTTVVHFPYLKEGCQKLKDNKIPFWSKNMGLGYPLYAEGEIGFFNPVNIIVCSLFDYKLAFNIRIIIYTIFFQIGLLFLSKKLFQNKYEVGLYLCSFAPFLPIYLMNYMQIPLVFPIFYIPYLMYFLLNYLDTRKKTNLLYFIIIASLQFLVSHYQTYFISTLFIFLFIFIDLIIRKSSKKELITTLIVLIFLYFLSLLLVSFQLFPTIEFFQNSSRSAPNYSIKWDQNMLWSSILTLVNPQLYGSIKNGTYPLHRIAHPWETILFIYYVPLFMIGLLMLKIKQNKNRYIFIFLFSLLLFFLLALGKNSPLFMVHSLPIFSSFRFPTRFNLIVVFILTILSAFGFDILISKFKNKSLILLLIVIGIVSIETTHFMYDFHTLIDSSKLFEGNPIEQFIKENNSRTYTPLFESRKSDNRYLLKGYDNLDPYYYKISTALLLGNLGLIYDIETLTNKAGPQLKRNESFISFIESNISLTNKKYTVLETANNLLVASGVKYIIATNNFIDNQYVKLINKFKLKALPVLNAYKILSKDSQRIRCFSDYYIGKTFDDFEKFMSLKSNNQVLIENDVGFFKKTINPDICKLNIKDNQDDYLRVTTNVETKKILYLADIYYPGWHAYIDGKETKVYRANLMFRGIVLPKGDHIVEFKYIPESFYLGVGVSMVTLVALIIIYVLSSRGVFRRRGILRRPTSDSSLRSE